MNIVDCKFTYLYEEDKPTIYTEDSMNCNNTKDTTNTLACTQPKKPLNFSSKTLIKTKIHNSI